MKTINPVRLHGLDHLRSLAIVMVLVFHYGRLFPHPKWTNSISKFGWTGVDLFFVLSGFLIASQLFSTINETNKVDLKDFYIKRFFRIIPAYLIVVIIYFLFPFVREREALAPLWKYLLFVQNYGLDVRTLGTFSHAWSLCIEEQFYFILPILLSILLYLRSFRWSYIIIVVLFISGFFIRNLSYAHFVAPYIDTDDAWGIYWFKWIYYPTYCRLDGLLVGISIAALFQFRPMLAERISKSGNLLFAISILILTGAYFLCLDQLSYAATVFGFPVVSIGYGFLVMAAISPSCFLYKIGSVITSGIATLSYSLYLSHKFVIHVCQEVFSSASITKDSNLMFFICIIGCVVIALLMNKIIEKPFLRLRNKVLVKYVRKQ